MKASSIPYMEMWVWLTPYIEIFMVFESMYGNVGVVKSAEGNRKSLCGNIYGHHYQVHNKIMCLLLNPYMEMWVYYHKHV